MKGYTIIERVYHACTVQYSTLQCNTVMYYTVLYTLDALTFPSLIRL